MQKLPNNASKSQVTKWEVVKSCEYANNCLSEIVTLYVIKMTQLLDFETNDAPETKTVLARVSVTSENVSLNKAISIEVMEDIFPYKFSSKKKKNTHRLEDLYDYLSSSIDNNLPKAMLESLVKEYQDAINLFKTIT